MTTTTTTIDTLTINRRAAYAVTAASMTLDRNRQTFAAGAKPVQIGGLAHQLAMHQQYAADGDYDAARGYAGAAWAACGSLLRYDGRTVQVRTVLADILGYLAQAHALYHLGT